MVAPPMDGVKVTSIDDLKLPDSGDAVMVSWSVSPEHDRTVMKMAIIQINPLT